MGESYEGFGSRQEEVANAITHAIGLVASALAFSVLVALAGRRGDVWEIVSVSIFGTTLMLLYLASTLYHSARSERARRYLKVVDHCAIYLLIAGTYTPFTLGVIRGGWGWALFGVMWGLAIVGVVFKFFFIGRFRLISTLIYLAMGWLGAVAAAPFLQQLSAASLVWLVLGGVAYTLGTPFYQMERFRYSHAVWHGFVMAGSACHVVAVMVQF